MMYPEALAEAGGRMPDRSTSRLSRRGYSLAEMLTVVIMLGIIAALVSYFMFWAVDDARAVAFQANARTFAEAAELYKIREGRYPESPALGVMPPNWEKYVDESRWLAPTPYGGQWHIGGDPLGLGVFYDSDAEEGTGEIDEDENVIQESITLDMENYDRIVDDGNLESGSFQMAGTSFFRHVFAQ